MMKYFKLFLYIFALTSIISCANRAAGPTGGLKDTIPPVVLRAVPLDGTLNYKKKEIQVFFNENITVDKVTENVIVSPPQKTQPVVKANGRVLSVVLQDELLDSTTYSILFGNAIVDLNEKNPLTNFTFSFATGPEIDTLKVSGRLFNAENLEPLSGIVVGLHKNLHDTAIISDQFIRIAKTDDEGRFTVQNVKSGSYKVYALSDLNRDFKYQPGEGIAFYDSIVIPKVHHVEKNDTLWKDSISIDTIFYSLKQTFLPDDITLKLFKENKKRQYLVKSERTNSKYFNLIFNAKQDSLPEISPLNFDLDTRFLVQANQNLDSLVYWIPDSAIFNLDTLSMAVRYLKTDSLFNLTPTVDTLNLSVRKLRAASRTRASTANIPEVSTVTPLTLKTNLIVNFDIYRDILLEFDEPLDSIINDKVMLLHKVDTILNQVDYEWIRKDSISRTFAIRYAWKPQESYELQVDSAAFLSIYGKHNLAMKTPFKIKSLDEYAALKIVLQNHDSLAYIQVLDPKELVLQTKQAQPNGTLFEHLPPGEYYIRLFIDANNNGVWDTGDVSNRKQPEEMLYYPKKLALRANWELEESWNHLDAEIKSKKPTELMKPKKK